MSNRTSLRYSLLLSFIALVLFLVPIGASASPLYALNDVINMWPTGGSSSTINAGDSFTVYVQVKKSGVTELGGQGANITCTLHWGQVPAFGGSWSNVTDTPMVYNTDVNNNDEYKATISPAAGLYEFTAFCTDTTDNDNKWQGSGNGKLTVNAPVGNVQWGSVLHDTFSTDYRNPGGAITAGGGGNIRLRLRVAQSDVTSIRVRVWNDRLNAETYYPMAWDGVFDTDPTTYDYWYADIPVPALPTILYYFFEINDGADQDFYTDDDPKFYGGGYGAMSDNYDDSKSFQITVYDSSFSVPSWIQRGVVYQIFPDRFRDGDTGNDPAAGEFFYGSNDTIFRSNDTDWNTTICDPRFGTCPSIYSQNFYGGDLAGITEKINAGYFDQLGVTVLYLNPIFSSPSNHKYDTSDYMTIDPDFGTKADFDAMVAAASAHGMRIILDGVFNHTSSDSTYFDIYSRYDASGNLVAGDNNTGACEGNTSSFYDWFYFQAGSYGSENGGTCNNGVSDAAQNYRAWYGYGSLPKLQANSTAVRNLIWALGTSSVGPYWVSQGASGWRFDVGGDVDPGLTNDPTNDYWEGFRTAVRTVNSSTITLGEEWGDASAWLLGNEWDSAMNYRFRSAALSWLFTGCAGGDPGCTGATWQDNDSNSGSASGAISYISPSQFNARLLSIKEDYPPQAWAAMLNLADSHDTNRLRFVLKQINNGDDDAAVQRMKELWLFAFTYAGAPTIYYGDEVGLSQDGVYSSGKYEDDPYNRAPFPWGDTTGDFSADTVLQDFLRTMSSIRQSYRALQDGSVVHGVVIDDANQLYGYARTYGSQTALIVLNRSSSTHSVTLSGLTAAPYNLTNGEVLVNALDGHTYTVSGGAVTVNVNPTWGVVLLEQSEIETPAAPADLSAAHTATDVTLSWDLVSRDTGGGVEVATRYTVHGSSDSGFTPDSGNLLDTVYPPSFGSTDARVSYTESIPAGPYYYAICAINAAGEQNCTTAYDPGLMPTVTTGTATDITDTSVTLNGTVNARDLETAVTFEYGLTTAYGASVTALESPLSGTTDTAVSYALTSLSPNTTYHFRTVGVNAAGGTDGLDASFTTLCASAITVTNTNDSGDGSLRQAIAGVCSGGTITFDPTLAGQTIRLTSATLTLNKNMTIDGSSLATPVTISGDANNSGVADTGDLIVFTVNAGVTATLDSLTITKGYGIGAGITNNGNLTVNDSNITENKNVAIYSLTGSSLTVTHSTFTNNGDPAGGSGGAIRVNDTTLTISDSIFTGNWGGTGGGGAIRNGGTSTTTITGSTFENNAARHGGALSQDGATTTTISNSTFFNNEATTGQGGAINVSGGSMTLTNSTFFDNQATLGNGGALDVILSADSVELVNSTFSNNGAPGAGLGGNVYIDADPGVFKYTNTILANASSDVDCYSTDIAAIGTNDHNLVESGTNCGTPAVSDDLGLVSTTLALNGGATGNLALLPGSPAINAGSGCPATDQRGMSRFGTCDIGTFESQGFSLSIGSGDGQSTRINTNFTDALEVTITANNPDEPVDGGIVTFTAVPAAGASAVLTGSPATISGGTASVTAAANGTGGAYTVAVDTAGAVAPVSFSLTNTTNSAPTVVDPIDDVTVNEDAANTLVDLSAVFADVDIATDGDSLTLSVDGNTNATLVTTSLVGTVLTLDYQPDQNGAASITVRATDSNGAYVDDTFLVTVNDINDDPTVANPIDNVTVNEDAANTLVDLSAVFADVDIATNADSLTLSVNGNTNATLVTTSLVGTVLTLDYQPNQNGTASITVRATDSNGAHVDDTFLVTVNAQNNTPTVDDPIDDVTVNEDAANTPVDLSAVFADVDIATNGDSLTLSVNSNTNATLVTTSLVGTTLTLDYLPDQNGAATITVRATDSNGAHVDDSFLVTVNAVNDTPTVANLIDDVTVNEDAANTLVDLSAIFADVDIATNADSLTLTVNSNTNPTLVTPTLVGTTLTLDYQPNQNGAATLTVRATDSNGAHVDDSFLVTVNAVNDAPTVALSNTVTTLPDNTNTSSRVKVADITVTDDGQGTNVLSLTGTDAALFEIDTAVLYLKAGTVLDYVANPTLDVNVEVDDASIPGAPDDSASLSITITDGHAPVLASITRHSPLTSPTNADTLVFQVTFNEDVLHLLDATLDFTVNGATSATVSSVAAVDARTYNITVSGGDLLDFNGTVGLNLSAGQNITDMAGNALTAGEPATNETYVVDNTSIEIALTGGVIGNPGSLEIIDLQTYTTHFTQIVVTFTADAYNPAGNTDPEDVTNPANYQIITTGVDGEFTSEGCGLVSPNDVPVPTGPVAYSNTDGFVATVTVNGGNPLPSGLYRLYLCGSTSITDLAGNELNGGSDVWLDFRITDPAVVTASAIPATGFAPDRVTALTEQTVSYTASDLWLEIPKLGVQMDIVGVPLVDGAWDISWLGKQAGWLEGSAYPTWNGNSVLTGHVVDANGKAGPFRYLNTLWYGDQVIVHAGGADYVYSVRSVQQVGPGSTAQLLKHEELPWVTLVTCRGYDPLTGDYKYRVLVRAVLIEVK